MRTRFGTARLVKWKGAWVYHFKDEQENLLDYQYKAIICYNGIHHFTSTKLLSLESKNQAVLNLMVEMSQNLKEVSTGLHGFKELKNFIKLTHDQLGSCPTRPLNKICSTYWSWRAFFFWSFCCCSFYRRKIQIQL